MILDLPRFIESERPYWTELDKIVEGLEANAAARMGYDELKRFHYLYERCSADLAKMITFAADDEAREHLESVVARAYGEIHSAAMGRRRPRLLHWFWRTFPGAFQRRIRFFWLSVALTILGTAFGAFALLIDQDAKRVLMPFQGLQGSPAERVAEEEKAKTDRMPNAHATFSAMLMTNNIRVSITTLAAGAGWGIGTVLILFYNGVILGAVATDYIRAGQTEFLLGWLLPHGVVEIPAILIAGQAGLLLAGAMIGFEKRGALRQRLREIAPDLVTLAGGVAVMLVWAGIVEAFISQYHRPVLPYGLKIGFGAVELVLLAVFLGKKR